MTISKFLMWAAALVFGAATLASCSKTDAPDAGDNDGAVRFTAGVTGQAVAAPVSRAADTDWTAGDEVGIFMVANGATSIMEGAENRKYTVTSAGSTATFTATDTEKIYYPMDGSAVNFIAYYPWSAGSALGTAIDVEIATTQTADSQAGFDLLYARADNSGSGYGKSNTPVALSFDHKLSKLVMNCKAGEGVDPADLPGMTVTIKGMNTKNTFNLATGTMGTADTPGTISPRVLDAAQGFAASYDAIIMPGSYDDGEVKVVFTVNSEPYTWTLAATDATFVSGNEYTYTVTLTKTGVTVTGEINPWITGSANDRSPVTAE